MGLDERSSMLALTRARIHGSMRFHLQIQIP